MERGIHLGLIQEYLGHNSPQTTAIYAHLTEIAEKAARKTINSLLNNF